MNTILFQGREVVPMVECGCCSSFHRAAYFGDCRDDTERFGDLQDAQERLGKEVVEVDEEDGAITPL